jgi:deoxyribodipyrimidine photo-lyase
MAAITSPDIPEMILPTLQELGLEFSEIDSRAAIQFKRRNGSNAAIKSLFF